MSKWIYFLFINLMLMPYEVFGHARFANTTAVLADGQVLTPRSTNNDAVKLAPCGGFGRTGGVIARPGQTITLNWVETIDHPGYYRIFFSAAGDTNWQMLGERQDNIVGALPHNFNMTVTLPNVTCDQCTLQLIQYMTENNPPSLYYSCADIRLTNGAIPPPPAMPPYIPPPVAEDVLRGCGATKVSSINASLSFALLLPIAGLLRRRKK